MDENQEKIKQDLSYYQTGIKQLYMRNYQVYLLSLLAIMLLTAVAIGVFSIGIRILFCFLLVAEFGLAIYIIRFMRVELFNNYFEKICAQLPQQFPKMQTVQVYEDAQNYYFSYSEADQIKINKKNARNFPSKISEYTLLVGFTPGISRTSIETPLYFYYYDVTQIQQKSK